MLLPVRSTNDSAHVYIYYQKTAAAAKRGFAFSKGAVVGEMVPAGSCRHAVAPRLALGAWAGHKTPRYDAVVRGFSLVPGGMHDRKGPHYM